MKNINQRFILSAIIILLAASTFAQSDKAKKADWQLGVQSYTFHNYSLKEAIAKANKLGINYVEAFYNQALGEGLEGTLLTMDNATQKKILEFAKSQQVKIIATGVVSHKKKDDWEGIFKRAKSLGIKIITCEPEHEDLKHVDQLANKYKIDVAIHNHPKPSDYWTLELFLENVNGLSKRIGACADIGHWKRMGIDPLEGIKRFGSRLKVVHLKDIEEKQEGKEYQDDVLPGTGVCDIEGIFRELKQQNFKGLFSIEYEGKQENLMSDMEEYVKYFNQSIDQLF